MKNTYYLPKARSLETGRIVTHIELSGQRFPAHERALCQTLADQLAAKLSLRGRESWVGFTQAIK